MIKLPDGNQIDMRWKSVSYIYDNKRMLFPIEPMVESADVICVPKADKYDSSEDLSLRNEFIFLLQTAAWKRDIEILEMNISPQILESDNSIVNEGSIESTEAGKKLESSYLFDPKSPLTSGQVKEIYLDLETKFAENVSGKVEIVKNGYLSGSVMEMITVPVLKKNKNVNSAFV